MKVYFSTHPDTQIEWHTETYCDRWAEIEDDNEAVEYLAEIRNHPTLSKIMRECRECQQIRLKKSIEAAKQAARHGRRRYYNP